MLNFCLFDRSRQPTFPFVNFGKQFCGHLAPILAFRDFRDPFHANTITLQLADLRIENATTPNFATKVGRKLGCIFRIDLAILVDNLIVGEFSRENIVAKTLAHRFAEVLARQA